MKNTFTYGEYSYEYYIEFSDRKSLTLIVRPDLRIIVRVPYGSSLDTIESFMRRKWLWLNKQLNELRAYRKTHLEKQYVSGEAFYYLGRQYMLMVEKSDQNEVKLQRGKLVIYTTSSPRDGVHNQKLVKEWLEQKRYRVFREEYLRALKLFNYKVIPQMHQRNMSRRWGSHTNDGKILLNPKLIHASRTAIHYVCVHELCHRTNKKHDAAFYKELSKRIPIWQEIKNKLEIELG